MTSSFRLIAIAAIPACVVGLGCSGSKPSAPYSANSGAAVPPTTYSAPVAPTGRAPGYSAPVYRGPMPSNAPSGAPVTVAPPPAPMPAPSTGSGGFRWASSLREAQDSARAQSKLIFIEAGRDACTNCQFLKNEVIPSGSVNGELGSMSVGIYDDVDRTPYSDAYNLLAANIPSAGSLPLAGWVTPDLRWVHGFWGRRDAGRFLTEISTARSMYQRMAAADRPATNLELGRLPSIGSLPDAELADVSAELADDRMIDVAPAAPFEPAASILATATPAAAAPTPTAEPTIASTDVAPSPAFAPIAPDEAATPIFAAMRPIAAPSLAPEAAVAPSVAPRTPEALTQAWVRDELKRAAAALATRQFTEARSILSGVRAKAKGTPESREADKGEVAIYNLRKIEKAGATAEADRLKAAAQRDLKDTVWVSLFA